MQIDFVFRGVSASEEIKTFITDKSHKLERYSAKPMHLKWTIGAEQDEIVSHLHVLGQQIDLFGESRDANFMTAVEDTVERVEKQLKKQKEILKDHHK
jgi:putative sigma-54 modulation protein